MATFTITHHPRVETARAFANSAAAGAPPYYVYVGDPTPLAGILVDAVDAVSALRGTRRSIVAGKLVGSTDVSLMIRNRPWTVNTVFTAYDDTIDLSNSGFYAVVNAGAFTHVWKCLENGANAVSTQQPVVADINVADDTVFYTADAYRWKYMYSVDSATVSKFATTTWFPVVANASVQSLAVNGSIDTVRVVAPGQGYGNYLIGQFRSGDIQVGNNTVYGVGGANSVPSSTASFYESCLIYIAAGAGQGQYRTVSHYFVNATGSFVVVNNAFGTTPGIASAFEIYPQVFFAADGGQSVVATA